MSNKKATKKNRVTKMTKRHYLTVVAFVVFSISLCAYLVLQAYPHLLITRTPEESEEIKVGEVETITTTPDGSLTRELPIHLSVPKLGIDADFESPLALNADRTISVPDSYDKVGWYKLGASPGEKGTASILGHIDSVAGPGVFYSLGQLTPGDRITVTRADSSVAEFEVEYLERYSQDAFPNEKVYGMTEYPSLRLITCSGVYSKGDMRYSHNLVVYARLVTEKTNN